MISADVKNDIKVIFFIVISINGLVPGISAFSSGVAWGVYELRYNVVPPIICIVIGLMVLGLAALGYAGAIRQNRIMLLIFAGLTMLAVITDIVAAALVYSVLFGIRAGLIAHLGLSVLAANLAVILAVKADKPANRNQGMILLTPPAHMEACGGAGPA